MSIEEKVPMNRTSITIVVVVLLCAAGFAYSQGWFNWSSSSYEMESNSVGTNQRIDPEKTNEDGAPTNDTAKPADAARSELRNRSTGDHAVRDVIACRNTEVPMAHPDKYVTTSLTPLLAQTDAGQGKGAHQVIALQLLRHC